MNPPRLTNLAPPPGVIARPVCLPGAVGQLGWRQATIAGMKRKSVRDQLQELQGRVTPGLARQLAIDHRLSEMNRALAALPAEAHEVLRHFPVAAVATLESYFKAVVANVIDHGSEYRERGLKLISDKSIKADEALCIVQSGIATLGQLVAHLLPCSTLAHLEGPLDQLLGFKIKQAMGVAVSVVALRQQLENPPLAVQDVSVLWQSLAELFERRHILAHEASMGYWVSAAQAKASIETITQFMAGVDAVLWSTVWKGEPITHREMTDRAWRERVAARQELASRLIYARKTRSLARRRQALWRTFFLRYMDGYADDAMGSIRLLIKFDQETELLRDRIKQIDSMESSLLMG